MTEPALDQDMFRASNIFPAYDGSGPPSTTRTMFIVYVWSPLLPKLNPSTAAMALCESREDATLFLENLKADTPDGWARGEWESEIVEMEVLKREVTH